MRRERPSITWPHPRGVQMLAALIALLVVAGAVVAFVPRGASNIVAGMCMFVVGLGWNVVFPWIVELRERGRVESAIARGVPPWEAAAPWRVRGIRPEAANRVRWRVVLVLLPLYAVLMGLTGWSPLFLYGGLLGGIPITVILAREALGGRVSVRSLAMPAFVGSTAKFSVAMATGGSSVSGLRCRLRCVRVVDYTAYTWRDSEVLHLIEPDGAVPDEAGPDEEVIVTFDIPERLPGTDLLAIRPIHWEVLVEGRTTWGEVWGVVQVPVYAAVPAA